MGCVHSKQETTSTPSVFKVSNVDSNGVETSRIHIEITERDLILHKPNERDSLVWPLKTIRRYGYEGVMFCIEVGRSSVYGQGIFAFRCKDAKLVFNTFKKALQINNLTNLASDMSLELHNICRPSFTQRNAFDKIYDEISFSGISNISGSINNSQSPYLSLDSDSITQPQNIYVNMFNNHEDNNDLQSTNSDELSKDNLTYTEVEIVACNNPVKKPPTPAETPIYTTIDFIRTMHLSSRKMFKCNDNTGVRKTRHDYE